MSNLKSSKLIWFKKMPNGSERYYSAEITEDLFNTVVFCTWGTKGTKLGGIKTHPVETTEQAETLLQTIVKRRKQRGYNLIINNI